MTSAWRFFALAISLLIVYFIKSYFQRSLYKIPGPFLGTISPAIRLWSAWSGKIHLHELELHRQYGKIVRVAPNTVSVSDPEAIGEVYSTTSNYVPSRFYDPFRVYDDEGLIPDPLAITDKALHRRVKRGAAHAYSLSSNLKLEPFFEEVLNKFITILDRYADSGEECDMSRNMQFFTMDNVLRMTLGRDMDLLRDESSHWMIKPLDDMLKYVTIVGQFPFLHQFLWGSKFYQKYLQKKDSILETILEWAGEEMNAAKRSDQGTNDIPQTFLQQLLTRQAKDPSAISDREIVTNLYVNITAGSDTSATAIKAVLIQLLNNPDAYSKVNSEVRNAFQQDFSASFTTANELPYLNAFIRESLRLHPPVQSLLAREVPPEGAQVCGQYLQGGVEVGVNAYIVHRDPDVFEDPETFSPERWLTDDKERLSRMNRAVFVFGGGPHTCSGRHIAMMVIVKCVAALVLRYDMAYGENVVVKTINYFIAPQKGLRMKLRRRF